MQGPFHSPATGVPIILDVDLNDALMGQELLALAVGDRPRLSVRVRGCNGLHQIRVVKNGQIVHGIPCHGEFDAALAWEDPDYSPDVPSSTCSRAVQIDRESAWSSPIWVG